jgi:hypothetical protein
MSALVRRDHYLCRKRKLLTSLSGEPRGKSSKNRQVCMEANAVKSANSERKQAPLMLEPTELAFNCTTAGTERLAALALARDERMQPVGLDPHACGCADGGGTAPLGCLALEVRTAEGPLAMLARWRLVLTALGSLGFPECGHGGDSSVHMRSGSGHRPSRPVTRAEIWAPRADRARGRADRST